MIVTPNKESKITITMDGRGEPTYCVEVE